MQLLNMVLNSQVNVGFLCFSWFFGRLPQLQVKEETGEVPGNGEALEGMVEVSPEAQEGGGVVERYPEATPQDVGLTTVPCCPGDPLQGLL